MSRTCRYRGYVKSSSRIHCPAATMRTTQLDLSSEGRIPLLRFYHCRSKSSTRRLKFYYPQKSTDCVQNLIAWGNWALFQNCLRTSPWAQMCGNWGKGQGVPDPEEQKVGNREFPKKHHLRGAWDWSAPWAWADSKVVLRLQVVRFPRYTVLHRKPLLHNTCSGIPCSGNFLNTQGRRSREFQSFHFSSYRKPLKLVRIWDRDAEGSWRLY